MTMSTPLSRALTLACDKDVYAHVKGPTLACEDDVYAPVKGMTLACEDDVYAPVKDPDTCL